MTIEEYQKLQAACKEEIQKFTDWVQSNAGDTILTLHTKSDSFVVFTAMLTQAVYSNRVLGMACTMDATLFHRYSATMVAYGIYLHDHGVKLSDVELPQYIEDAIQDALNREDKPNANDSK